MLIPSCFGATEADGPGYLTSYLVNDTLAIDVGSLGFYASPQEQGRVRHVLLSHTHMDHLASLPIFLENVYDMGGPPVTVYGSADVISSLRRDIFNDRLWPDFIALSEGRTPFLKIEQLEADRPLVLDGVRITPVPIHHVVPTFAFLLEEDNVAVAIVTDTGPTDAIWKRLNQTPNLKAVFLEATFPAALTPLAQVSQHLTPAQFAGEVGKLEKRTSVRAVHIKPRFYNQVVAELRALGLPDLEVVQGGKVYEY